MYFMNVEDVPTDRFVSPYIYSGYRVGLTPRKSFMSAFTIHNETINIWSHSIPLIFGMLIISQNWNMLYSSPTVDAASTILSATGTCVLCPLASMWTHTFWLAEHPFMRYAWAVDFIGVSFAVIAGCTGVTWIILADLPHIRCIILLSFLLLAYRLVYTAVTEHIRHVNRRPLLPRDSFPEFKFPTVILVVLGWIFPLTLGMWLPLNTELREAIKIAWFCPLLMALGMTVLVLQYPERYYTPGRFDIVGNSHQIWHIFTGVCMIIWCETLFRMHEARVR